MSYYYLLLPKNTTRTYKLILWKRIVHGEQFVSANTTKKNYNYRHDTTLSFAAGSSPLPIVQKRRKRLLKEYKTTTTVASAVTNSQWQTWKKLKHTNCSYSGCQNCSWINISSKHNSTLKTRDSNALYWSTRSNVLPRKCTGLEQERQALAKKKGCVELATKMTFQDIVHVFQ